MEPILTIDNLNSFGGNMLRQGDKSQLKYRLKDVGNKNLGISGKSCEIKMYGRNYTTVVYETTTTVTTENTVSFTIDKVLPKGTFYLEFTVGDYIFPTDHREFFEITPSGKGVEANIIEIVGKDVLINAVKSQVDTELQPLVTTLESAQQAETERATAESDRVSAEEQRELDHANRSAELSGKADKVVLENLIKNGNFSDGTEGWSGIPNHATTGNKVVIDYDGSARRYLYYTYQREMGIIMYSRLKMKVINNPNPNSTLLSHVTNGISNFVTLPDDGEEIIISGREMSTSTGGTVNQLSFILSSPFIGEFSEFISINLTETFGAGNEPSKEEMDRLIEITGYIDGEYALNNKEMLIWTLALIRRNRNAIVALGGA